MTVKNVSSKVIGLGKVNLLPDQTANLGEYEKNPVVKVYLDKGFLKEVKETSANAATKK